MKQSQPDRILRKWMKQPVWCRNLFFLQSFVELFVCFLFCFVLYKKPFTVKKIQIIMLIELSLKSKLSDRILCALNLEEKWQWEELWQFKILLSQQSSAWVSCKTGILFRHYFFALHIEVPQNRIFYFKHHFSSWETSNTLLISVRSYSS